VVPRWKVDAVDAVDAWLEDERPSHPLTVLVDGIIEILQLHGTDAITDEFTVHGRRPCTDGREKIVLGPVDESVVLVVFTDYDEKAVVVDTVTCNIIEI
jgi:hypothetical protein